MLSSTKMPVLSKTRRAELAPAHQSQATHWARAESMEPLQQLLRRLPELNMHVNAIAAITQSLMDERERILQRLPEIDMSFEEILAQGTPSRVLGKRARPLDNSQACSQEDAAALKKFKP